MNERSDTISVIARALCSSMRWRGSSACFCHGDLKNCHAATLYQDFATAALFGLERAGYTVSRPGFVEFHDAPTIEAAVKSTVAAMSQQERDDWLTGKWAEEEFDTETDHPTLEEACDTVDQLAREMAETLGNALDDMRAAWPESAT